MQTEEEHVLLQLFVRTMFQERFVLRLLAVPPENEPDAGMLFSGRYRKRL
jgi:hypothetical protein